MNKNWNWFFTIALLLGLIFSCPHHSALAQTLENAKFTPDLSLSEQYQNDFGSGSLAVVLLKETPIMSLFISTPTYYGQPFNIRAMVRTSGGSPVAGSVDFSIDEVPVAVCQDVIQDEFGDYFCQNVSLPILVGEHTLSASFTPTDTDTFDPVSGSIPFTVQSGSYLISGIVFNDSDQDGEMDTTEYGISSWTFNLTTCDGDPVMGTNGSVIGPQVTGYFGLFTFTNVPGGQCIHITEEIQTGWQATTPTQIELTLSQDVHLLHFGNYYPYISVNLVGDALPEGVVGQLYGPKSFTATGGEGPYSFSIMDGELPDGLQLSVEGVLSGTPTSAGEYLFTVKAEDQNQAIGYQYYFIKVSTEDTYSIFLPLVMK